MNFKLLEALLNPAASALRLPLQRAILFAGFLGSLTAAAGAADVTLKWDAVPGGTAAGYRLCCGTEPGDYSRTLEAGTATSLKVTDLTPGTTWFFAVKAYSAAGVESAPSSEVSHAAPKEEQFITFSPLAGRTFGDASFALSASGGLSGQPVTFTVESGPAVLSRDNMLTLTGTGVVTVRASQSGSDTHLEAPDAVQSFTVRALDKTATVAVSEPGGAEISFGGTRTFGAVAGGGAASLAFTVRNTGDAPLSLGEIISGDPQFAVTAAPRGTLAPGGEDTFTVTFTPASTGFKSAVLHLSGGEPPGELFSMVLTGTGGTGAYARQGSPFGDSGGSPQLTPLPNGSVRVSFRVLPGTTCLLQRSADLVSWPMEMSVTAGSGGDILFVDENPPSPGAFYRLRTL